MPIFRINHLTTYRYSRAVRFGEHRMMLRPRESYDQRLIEATLTITPEPVSLRWTNDVFGNAIAIARFDAKAEELAFRSKVTVEHSPLNAPDFMIDDAALNYPFVYPPDEAPDLEPWTAIGDSESNSEVDSWTQQFLQGQRPIETGRLLMTITNAIKESFTYVRRAEPGTQTPAETLASGSGSCRDYAVLMIAAMRRLGLAARFVSGYVYTGVEGERRGGGSTHAWCQVYLPGAGWVDFDPTNGIVGNRDLIRVAVGREPMQAVPLSGQYSGSVDDRAAMNVEVDVRRLEQRPAGNGALAGSGKIGEK